MLLSICIPCYKRVEQVRVTLKSIFDENSDVPVSDYEVVISDNDPDREIDSILQEFNYPNLKYFYTNCEGFMNSYHVLTYAEGDCLKLHNSQSVFKKGSLARILSDARKAQAHKTLLFYSNGMLNKKRIIEYDNFNDFMFGLSYWSSWSNGFCIWKDEFDRIAGIELNQLFPHTSLFLTQHKAEHYTINDECLFEVQRISKRGGHNKFEAFTIEYPSLIDNAYSQGAITYRCRQHILKKILLEFLPTLLFNKYIARIECFEINGYKQNIKKYFPRYSFYLTYVLMFFVPFYKIYNRIKKF